MSEENIESITKSDSNFAPAFVNHHLLPGTKFNGHCLTKNNISIPKKVIKLYIFYILSPCWNLNLNADFALNNCLFGSLKLTKDADLDKYKCSCNDIGFDSFRDDMRSSVHIDNKNKISQFLVKDQHKG